MKRPSLPWVEPMPETSLAQAALEYAKAGWTVFPVAPKGKQPLTARGFHDASADPEQVKRWWASTPDANIGYAVPDGEVVVDVDGATDVELPATLTSDTGKGQHHFYATTLPLKQQVRIRPNVDTRTAGSGYVILPPSVHPSGRVYHWRDDWRTREKAAAPRWLSERPSTPDLLVTASGGAWQEPTDGYHEAELVSLAGHLRRIGNDEDTIFVVLQSKGAVHKPENGGKPYSDSEYRRIAHSVARYDPEPTPQPTSTDRISGMDAMDLLAMDLPPLLWAVGGLIPEGMGILAAPPKAGKSLLCYQLAVALVTGTALFGDVVPAERRPVLYFALEDGYRRSQDRVRHALRGQPMVKGLRLEWETTALGSGLEESVAKWLGENTHGFVIIDVLAKVKPVNNGKRQGNAYEEDYAMLSKLQRVAQNSPGAVILVVTHDRKQSSEDWVTLVSGTRGVTGVADFLLYLRRPRGKMTAELMVAGRDVEDAQHQLELVDHRWVVGTASLDDEDLDVGPAKLLAFMKDHTALQTPMEIADEMGALNNTVSHWLSRLRQEGKVSRNAYGRWTVVPEEAPF